MKKLVKWKSDRQNTYLFLYLSVYLVFILLYGPDKRRNHKYTGVCELPSQGKLVEADSAAPLIKARGLDSWQFSLLLHVVGRYRRHQTWGKGEEPSQPDPSQPSWLLCVIPHKQVQGPAGGEAAGTTTCCHSGNSQGVIKQGARPGTPTVGCTLIKYFTTKQLEIVDVYLSVWEVGLGWV